MTLPAVGAKLNSPDHRIFHRILDIDSAAPEQSVIINSSGNLALRGANGQETNNVFVMTEVTGMSGAAVTSLNLIVLGSFIIGVTIRVTTTITGATTFDIGDGTDVDRWGAGIALAAGTTTTIADFTADGFGQFAASGDVVLTANGSNFTAGAVRIVVHNMHLKGPTS